MLNLLQKQPLCMHLCNLLHACTRTCICICVACVGVAYTINYTHFSVLSASMFLFCVITAAKKNQVSQANKLKREERLNEIDDLLQNNKELQEQIMQKLDEARALNATTEVENPPYLFSKRHWLSMHNTIIFTCLKQIEGYCSYLQVYAT